MASFNPLEGLTLSKIIQDQVPNLIWWIICLIVLTARYAYGWLTRKTKLGATEKILTFYCIIAFSLTISVSEPERLKVIAAFVALALVAAFSLRGLIRAGIVDAFDKTRSGIDFATSLRLAQSSISFLGIGADKISKLGEFESAIERCSAKGQTCRFLVSSPDNTLLETLARRNNVTPDAYRQNVRDRLRRIARLQIDRHLNIEVRFYPHTNRRDLQQFRLMFIDDRTCLLSWTIWGDHLGRDNPQIILKDKNGAHGNSTLFKAFKGYYDELWGDALVVDLRQFI